MLGLMVGQNLLLSTQRQQLDIVVLMQTGFGLGYLLGYSTTHHVISPSQLCGECLLCKR